MRPGKANSDEIASVVSAQRFREGLVVVVSAPSGTGKTTVCEKLLAEMPDIKRSVSFTTRAPREDEEDERHYHFVTREKFLEERDKGRFVEWAEVHGYLYGTPRNYLEKRIRTGKDTVLVIDVHGARAIKESFQGALLIFLLPPSLAELERRLKERSSGSGEDIRLRLKNAAAEFHCYRAYDYLVVNDNVTETVDALRAIITAERYRITRVNPR